MRDRLDRIRRLFPPKGLRYNLFDTGGAVVLIAWLWYVGSKPSRATNAALGDTLSQALDPRVWGTGVFIVGLLACGLAYVPRDRIVDAGYALLGAVCIAWSVSLLFGGAWAMVSTYGYSQTAHIVFVTHDGSLWDDVSKAWGAGVLFAWLFRGLVVGVLRDGDR